MKIDWEVVRKEDIERLREIYSNPIKYGLFLIRETPVGWMKVKITKTISDIPHTEILSGGFKTLEECQNYESRIEKRMMS